MYRFLVLYFLSSLVVFAVEDVVPIDFEQFPDYSVLLDECAQEIKHSSFRRMVFSTVNIRGNRIAGYGAQDIFDEHGRLCVCALAKIFTKPRLNAHERIDHVIDFIARVRLGCARKQNSADAEHFGLKRLRSGGLVTLMDGDHRLFWAQNFLDLKIFKGDHFAACFPSVALSERSRLAWAITCGQVFLAIKPDGFYVMKLQQAYDYLYPANPATDTQKIGLSYVGIMTGDVYKKDDDGRLRRFQDSKAKDRIAIVHADPNHFAEGYLLLKKILKELQEQHTSLSNERLMDLIAVSHWVLAGLTPHLRGGGTVAEWWARGLFHAFFPQQLFARFREYEPWSMAVMLGVSDFVAHYKNNIVFESR